MEELKEYFYRNYLPRKEIQYRLPVSTGIREFWPEELEYRRERAVMLPLRSYDGHEYWYCPVESFLKAGDRLMELIRGGVCNTLDKYASDESMMDEAYYSSVIEGAYTTRQEARELILSGAEPEDRDQRMILNNYKALQFVTEHMDAAVNEEFIVEIARILTDGTLEGKMPDGYRDQSVRVMSGRQEVVYEAPDAKYVREMMDQLIRYIAETEDHPIVKACVTHIYFVTVHPFVDGNGRTARALSWMILLQAGYDLIRQFPVSGILAQERTKYYKSIQASQNPENGYDLTYFLDFYTQMLVRSAEEMLKKVRRYQKLTTAEEELKGAAGAERILKGAKWLIQQNIESITAEKWQNKFKVSFETARKDLNRLEEAGIVKKRTVGHKHFYDAAE